MIFQDPFGSLNPRMPVAKIIAEGLEARGDLRSAERAAEVTRLLELVSLSGDMEQRLPRRLSGGQRQRVAIARALAANPAVLIADEITSALDVSVQAQVLNVLRGILATQGLSMLFISHNLAVVRYISDDLAVMRDGVIVEGRPDRRSPGRPPPPLHPRTPRRYSAPPRPRRNDANRTGLLVHGTRLNAWDGVPLQPYCSSWTPLPVEGASRHRPELSATNE